MLTHDPRSTFRLCLCYTLSAILVAALTATSLVADTQPAAKASAVTLVIDYGDGVQKHFTQLAWRPRMTVWNLLEAAEKHPRGLRLKFRGQEDTLFVTQIDDVANQSDRTNRNWIFRVNDQLGEASAGITEVKEGDRVEWRYESLESLQSGSQ